MGSRNNITQKPALIFPDDDKAAQKLLRIFKKIYLIEFSLIE